MRVLNFFILLAFILFVFFLVRGFNVQMNERRESRKNDKKES